MAYAELKDIERLIAQFVVANSSKPNQVQVESIITDTEHEVNTALSSHQVTIPVTEPEHYVGWLRSVVCYGATAATLKSMFPAATGPGENPAFAFWESRYKAALAGIKDGTLIPAGVATTSHTVRPSNYYTNNQRTLHCEEIPWFRRSMGS